MTPLHAVFATTPDHKTFRVSDPLPWGQAHDEWEKLDDARRAGRLPQTKFFEVRSVTLGPDRPLVGPEVRSHDRYDKAPLDVTLTRPVVGRGFADGKRDPHSGRDPHTGREKAARAAWKLSFPTFRSRWDKTGTDKTAKTGVQGAGGWYFYPNGVTAAQGLRSLANLAERRRMVVQGADGRWYVVDPDA